MVSKSLPIFAQQVGRELPSVVAGRGENGGDTATIVLYMSRRDEGQQSVP